MGGGPKYAQANDANLSSLDEGFGKYASVARRTSLARHWLPLLRNREPLEKVVECELDPLIAGADERSDEVCSVDEAAFAYDHDTELRNAE